MGHPVFRVIQDYDDAKKQLILKVTQEQKSDTESQYHKASMFQTSSDYLIVTTKAADTRVRARAVTSLAGTKDTSLADTYAQLLNDRSYGVIRAAAVAFGQTRSAAAYDALAKLIDQPSWRDTIRASGLSGLAALGDKRALEPGFKYSASGNRTPVRAAALTLLGNTGKDDPRTLAILTGALNEGFERRNF